MYVDDASRLVSGGVSEKTTVRAIEPVRGGSEDLLLSAWDDGTYRQVYLIRLIVGC
jgi:hypothetical protein